VSTAALGSIMGGEINQDMNVCLMDEQDARAELVKNWASYPAIAKERCVQPKEYYPGYVEWVTCLTMTKDVLDLRKQNKGDTGTSGIGISDTGTSGTGTSGTGTSGTGTSGLGTKQRPSARRANPATGECPVVKYTEGGDIDYITNCPGPAMPSMDVAR
jgi:hypothetical protein